MIGDPSFTITVPSLNIYQLTQQQYIQLQPLVTTTTGTGWQLVQLPTSLSINQDDFKRNTLTKYITSSLCPAFSRIDIVIKNKLTQETAKIRTHNLCRMLFQMTKQMTHTLLAQSFTIEALIIFINGYFHNDEVYDVTIKLVDKDVRPPITLEQFVEHLGSLDDWLSIV